MYIPLNWIKEYTNVDLDVEKLVEEVATKIGAVEETIDLAKKYEGITIAKVIEKKDHPNADKLAVYIVDTGEKQVQVVTGDKTLEVSDKVAYFAPGVKVPYNAYPEKYDGVISKVSLRGVESEGMMASERELDLGNDHTKIMRLESDAVVGEDFAKTYGLNDTVLDIENKALANRADLFGIVGISREISACQSMKFQSPDWAMRTDVSTLSGNTTVVVDNQINTYCKRYMAIAMDNVLVTDSPIWLKATLAKVGIRSINNIVDITNYMMYLTSQPLHAFDLDKVLEKSGRTSPTIAVRLAKNGESITVLGGKTVDLDDSTVIITDGQNPIGIAGIIGGQDTEIDSTTKRIIIECANFDRYNIRKTSMRLGIFTEAVTRFTKAQDPNNCPNVLLKTVEMVSELAKGTVASEVVDNYIQPVKNKVITLDLKRANTILGIDLKSVEVETLLTNLEYSVDVKDEGTLIVTVPTFRQDIDIVEDLYEDIGRHYGYNNVKVTLPTRSIYPNSVNSMLEFKDKLRDIITKIGGNELLTYNFIDGKDLEKYGLDTSEAYKLTNPLSPELEYMRYDILPSILEKVSINVDQGYGEFILYEMNKGHSKNQQDFDSNENLPKEREYLGVVSLNPHYTGTPFYVAKAILSKILSSLNIGNYDLVLLKDVENIEKRWVERLNGMLDINRSAILIINNEIVGVVGQCSQKVKQRTKLPAGVSVLELDLDSLIGYAQDSYGYVEPSRYPKTSQDFCFEVSLNTTYKEVYEMVKKIVTDVNYVYVIEPVDIYHKDGDEKKKITIRLELQHRDRTLTKYDITQLRNTLEKEVSSL